MKTALDNYQIGKLKEVDIDNLPYIDRSTNRFVCPECKEPVHIVIRDSGTKYFAHLSKKKALVKECNRRIEASLNKSAYERMGLPIYLRNENNRYSLYLGFRSLPFSIMQKCQFANSFIEISGISIFPQKYFIKDYNFNERNITYKKIDFLSKYKSITIKYSDNDTRELLKPYWSDYVEEINFDYGMLFTSGIRGGRMIRSGEAISTFTEYYWVTQRSRITDTFGEIKQDKLGTINFTNDVFNVFLVSFNTTTKNEMKYMNLYNYLLKNLKVFLLEKTSLFVPMWPPSIQCEDGYIFLKEGLVIYTVETNNEEPMVYLYIGNSALPVKSYPKKIKKSYFSSLYVRKQNTLITVDGKNVSNGVSIKSEEIKQKYIYSLMTDDNKDLEIFVSSLEEIKIYTKESLDAYFIDNNFRILKETFVNGEISFSRNKLIKMILLVSGRQILKVIHINNSKKNVSYNELINERELFKLVSCSSNKKKVALNSIYIRDVNFIIDNYPLCRKKFMEYKKENLIPISVLVRIRGVKND